MLGLMVAGLADIGAEAILLLGAGRAILLQLAHPAVGRGVVEHSTFTAHPLDRFRATMTFMYAATYGTDEQKAAVRRMVNRAHAPVRGAAEGAQAGYSAFDADLQLWVLATLYDSTVTVYQMVYGALADEEADAIYRDYARIGTILQVPAKLWPADRAGFGAYWTAGLQELRTDAGTVRVARELLHPKAVPWWMRACMPAVRLVTAGLLPAPVRADFALPWSARRQRRFARVMAGMASVYPRLPRRVRHGLKDRYLRRLDGQART
jgi:uncharacterized protein (DUF2236 family)